MFAVKAGPVNRKLTASMRPVPAVIPSRTYGTTFSAVGLLAVARVPTY